jgi:hypothetical protein
MKKTRKQDDWAAYEHACEIFVDIRARLKAGAVVLDADESDLVLKHLPKKLAKPASRQPKIDYVAIKLYCLKRKREYQREGMLPDKAASNAVAKTATHFKRSKWVVNKALRMRVFEEADVD